ncbi:TPA: DEAD/DEAH box helicase [Candidatus Poribacteria bacterium]|nr:DEAD/DEAH box helicase [Candidatus Poribacteria bacterium]HIO09141.1 DEAD/DEAH box helicase [Candidatus Poribacteria bacterium]
MDVPQFLDKLFSSTSYQDQIVYTKHLPKRDARFKELSEPILPPLQRALDRIGIHRFYTHQAESIDLIRGGKDIIIETGTASGKTLCYNLPVLESILENHSNCALYLFPTKALAQDQIRSIQNFVDTDTKIKSIVTIKSYDGDTPKENRPEIRRSANILISNPDMINLAILPNHQRWSRFFQNLKYIIIDEMHIYHGPFGSHVANIIRRLSRISNHYGANPQFICCSATIANPVESAGAMINRPVQLVNQDGAPQGERTFLIWNPPIVNPSENTRRNTSSEAQELIANLMESEIQTIAFTQTRATAELICRYVRELLNFASPELTERIQAYRGGYLPRYRREIEQKLASGKLLSVVTTNALELGIDVGNLDACVIVGFPGTIASLWQQAGRVGRGSSTSLIILIVNNLPIEQYLTQHPEYLFERMPEQTVVSPENPYILAEHLRCAAHEIPLRKSDQKFFGKKMPFIADYLYKKGNLKRSGTQYYIVQSDYPSRHVDLRSVPSRVYAIKDIQTKKVIGTIDGARIFSHAHPGAIYLHNSETYLVKELDVDNRVVTTEPVTSDYYTQSVVVEHIDIIESRGQKNWGDSTIETGKILIKSRATEFRQITFHSHEFVGRKVLDLPEQRVQTLGTWFIPNPDLFPFIERELQLSYFGGLEAIKNVLESILPLYTMSEQQGCRGKVQPNDGGELAIFLLDAYPGGLGYTETSYNQFGKMMLHASEIISGCGCRDGCPSCVHPMYMFASSDEKPDKQTAMEILKLILQSV